MINSTTGVLYADSEYCVYTVRDSEGRTLAHCRRKPQLDNLCETHHPQLHAEWFERWQREHGFG